MLLRRVPAQPAPSGALRRQRVPSRPACSVRVTGSRGSATAETAVLLPVLVVVLTAAIWVLACVAAQLKCVDAARAGARAAARGDAPAQVRDVATRLAPPQARVATSDGDGTVEVRVSSEVRPFGAILRLLPAVSVSGRATAAVEPGAAP